MFDIEEIMRNVPHRFPFLLIDRVTAFEKDASVTTLKNVTINEAQFQGHFPGKPVFPGVLIIENMAQSGCFLLIKSAGEIQANAVYYLGRVQKMAFRKPVTPGDQLVTRVELVKKLGPTAKVACESTVDGVVVASGEMMFAQGS
jgi:3-hydroxyacyl-[acyl-carrier-protein] dehydratase